MDCYSICADDAIGIEYWNGCMDLCSTFGVLICYMVGMCGFDEKQAIGGNQWRMLGIWSYRCSSSIWVNYSYLHWVFSVVRIHGRKLLCNGANVLAIGDNKEADSGTCAHDTVPVNTKQIRKHMSLNSVSHRRCP